MHCQFCGAALESLPVRCPFCAAQPVLGDRYEINAIIGRGGMGEVFLARDRRLDNDVAIKRLTPQLASSQELRESLRREAQIMARLSDSTIVRLFDLAEFFGDFYLILEYVPGPTLRDMIRKGYKAPPGELVKIIGEVCQGLTVAHNAGVIHRDLKPSNLLLALRDAEENAFTTAKVLPANLLNAKVKITDFGIAKAIAEARVTMTNAFSGTPGYMAPEQFRGEVPSPPTDVYALGVVTYELLTGALPTQPVPTIESVHPAVTEVIRKALSPSRQDRFPSAAAFYEGLYNAIEGRSPLRPALVPAKPISPATKGVVFAALMTMLSGLLLSLILLDRQSSSRHPHYVRTDPPPPKKVTPPPTPIEWRPFKRVSELPPVVEEARGKPGAPDLLGPEHPTVKWEVSFPMITGSRLVAVGNDGTAYMHGMMSEIFAVREGKVQWAFKSAEFAATIQDLQLDQDGRLWFKIHTMGEAERYCLNRDGEGGRLPRAFENQGPKYVDSAPYSCWKNKHTLSGPQGDLDIPDDDCLRVALGRDGRIYVATDLPQILTVSKQGRFEAKYKPSCQPSALLPTLANRLVFSCPDNTLHALTGMAEAWSRTTDGQIASPQADSAGTIYYSDRPKGAEASHLHAIDAQGKDLWTVELPGTPEGVAFGSERRMYIVQFMHGVSLSTHLTCISD